MDNARFQSEFVDGVEGWLERVTSMRSMDILDFQEGRIQFRNATPAVVKRLRRPDLSSFTAKWSCPWPQAA